MKKVNKNRIKLRKVYKMQAMLNMARRGYHAKTIGKKVGFSPAMVYYHCKLHGVKLRDYRNGKGSIAKEGIKLACLVMEGG